jgi:hypothetical protein
MLPQTRTQTPPRSTTKKNNCQNSGIVITLAGTAQQDSTRMQMAQTIASTVTAGVLLETFIKPLASSAELARTKVRQGNLAATLADQAHTNRAWGK